MTIVAALRQAGKIVYGYNDGAELDATPVLGTECPWITFGDWALGITGESGVQAIIAHAVRVSPAIEDAYELIEHFRELLIANYVGSKEADEYVTAFGVYSILAHRSGRVWDVSGCLSLTEIPEGKLWANGSGRNFAIGADYASVLLGRVTAPADRVRIAVEAAIANDLHCVGEPVVRSF